MSHLENTFSITIFWTGLPGVLAKTSACYFSKWFRADLLTKENVVNLFFSCANKEKSRKAFSDREKGRR